ncbi:hypothetical protein [Lacticaseibacillus nasuensis]|uniref:hypothetical protein n=1 Tax=Lacticaseibacillus nasuensis TaxID=944671 RepID=UPI0006D12D23|nr:hypothetical protein [Lacticaseibacillus nasuensis]
MLVQLWGSWLVLWLLARLLGLALMVGSFLALAWLPGRREQRLFGLFAHGGRGFYLLLLGVMTLALLGVALLATGGLPPLGLPRGGWPWLAPWAFV